MPKGAERGVPKVSVPKEVCLKAVCLKVPQVVGASFEVFQMS